MRTEKITKFEYTSPSMKEYGSVSGLVGGGAQPGGNADGLGNYTS